MADSLDAHYVYAKGGVETVQAQLQKLEKSKGNMNGRNPQCLTSGLCVWAVGEGHERRASTFVLDTIYFNTLLFKYQGYLHFIYIDTLRF